MRRFGMGFALAAVIGLAFVGCAKQDEGADAPPGANKQTVPLLTAPPDKPHPSLPSSGGANSNPGVPSKPPVGGSGN